MPLSKKSQTSFFVIVGLIMFIAVIIGFFAYNNLQAENIKGEAKKTSDLSLQAEEIKKFVNDCVRKAAFEGLRTIGQTGGYIEVPKIISFKGTSLWYLDQVNIQPFLNQTQERLVEYINSNLPQCVENENLSKLGFSIEKGQPLTLMEFGADDVTLKVVYPIKLSKGDFTKDFSEFFNTFDIRYRATFEAATELNEKLFDADFDIKEPLKRLGYLKDLNFDITYKTPETDIMEFTIIDKRSITPTNEFYTFNFAAKLGKSELKRLTDLQNHSSTNPAFLSYTIFSVDKKAQLDIFSGATISLNGQDVPFISVQQSYPESAVTKNVPVEKENKEIKRREDLIYVLDNPVYSFEPDGLLFNKPQTLTLYYDDSQGKDSKGVGILKGNSEFWVPIPSQEDRANRKVFSSILGFTEFTAIFCQSQQLKKTIARQVFEPNAGCYINLAVFVITLALTFYFAPLITIFTQGFAALTTTQIIVLAASLISTGLGAAGSVTEAYYESSPENCQGFVPSCTWQVSIDGVKQDGEGKCIPNSGTFQGGVQVNLCAQVQKCNFIEKFTCQECSVECTAQFY